MQHSVLSAKQKTISESTTCVFLLAKQGTIRTITNLLVRSVPTTAIIAIMMELALNAVYIMTIER